MPRQRQPQPTGKPPYALIRWWVTVPSQAVKTPLSQSFPGQWVSAAPLRVAWCGRLRCMRPGGSRRFATRPTTRRLPWRLPCSRAVLPFPTFARHMRLALRSGCDRTVAPLPHICRQMFAQTASTTEYQLQCFDGPVLFILHTINVHIVEHATSMLV